MPDYIVNPENIARIAVQTMYDLSGNFDNMECVMGLCEAMGRIIVQTGKTPVEMQQMVKVANDHLISVIKAGCNTKGFTV